MVSPLSQRQGKNPESLTEQDDSKCIQSTSKKHFDPSTTYDSRSAFFAVYHRLLDEFDGRLEKYRDRLRTTLVPSGISALVMSMFFLDMMSKFQQPPNRITVAQMKMLIDTPLPDADHKPFAGISLLTETVMALLCASFMASLLASSLTLSTMGLIDRYLWNCGGGFAGGGGRRRHQKLDRFKKWHLDIAIESPVVTLRLSILLFWCTLPGYLWTTSEFLDWIMISFVPVALGITGHIFLALDGIRSTNPFRRKPLLGRAR